MLQFKPGDRVPVPAVAPFRLFCGEVLRKWPHFTEFDVRKTEREPSRLIAMLEETYGYSRNRAERELDLLIQEFGEKMQRAA